MKNIKEYIESGILELYVLGQTTQEETQEVEGLAAKHEVIRSEIEAIQKTVESYAVRNGAQGKQVLKPLIMAAIDYSEKVKNSNEKLPLLLEQSSRIEDYKEWLEKNNNLPTDFSNVHQIVICDTTKVITSIFWVKNSLPPETHFRSSERFLIVEGSCNIIVDEEIHMLKRGDYFYIPLGKPHRVEVTSDIPCKVILQKVLV